MADDVESSLAPSIAFLLSLSFVLAREFSTKSGGGPTAQASRRSRCGVPAAVQGAPDHGRTLPEGGKPRYYVDRWSIAGARSGLDRFRTSVDFGRASARRAA